MKKHSKKKETHKKINSVAIYCHNKPAKEKIETAFLRELLRFFHKKGIDKITGDIRTVSLLSSTIPLIEPEKSYDLKIGLGGDGILLKMVRTLQKNDGLCLGVNFGSMGFLSEVKPSNAIASLEKIFRSNFHVDTRNLLKVQVYRKNIKGKKEEIFRAYALNEIVFGHGGLARLINFNVKVDKRYLSTYRSDGIIFSTPTGSTAYSMSAGGPIVSPSIPSIVVTPVSPHTMTHRPIILSNEKKIDMNFDSRVDSIAMTVDGQIYFSLKSSDEIVIKKATRTMNFVRLKESHYYKTLRNKLGWGHIR